MEKNILVVGAGVAGISVAKNLLDRGITTTVIDNGQNDCSAIAGALITPMVFRRMNKSWRVDEFIEEVKVFYPQFGDDILEEVPLRRMFSSVQEREFWLKKMIQSEYSNYLVPIEPEDDSFNLVKNEYGSGRLKNVFKVNSASFMDSGKSYIEQHGIFLNGAFDYSRLNLSEYKGTNYTDIVFCEGHQIRKNPWFGSLPVNKTKGEILTVHATSIPSDLSVNRKCFMLPLGNSRFKVGSTYSWNDDSVSPTENGRDQILNNLSVITDEKVKIEDHVAGVRPTTIDRRPIMGTHDTYNFLHVFNGLGTKGFLLAPTLAKEFVSYLLDNSELDPEVRLNRFTK